jgi:hypothetical protein
MMAAFAAELFVGSAIYIFGKSLSDSFNYGWAAGVFGAGAMRLIDWPLS